MENGGRIHRAARTKHRKPYPTEKNHFFSTTANFPQSPNVQEAQQPQQPPSIAWTSCPSAPLRPTRNNRNNPPFTPATETFFSIPPPFHDHVIFQKMREMRKKPHPWLGSPIRNNRNNPMLPGLSAHSPWLRSRCPRVSLWAMNTSAPPRNAPSLPTPGIIDFPVKSHPR